ncbi:MAG: (4Fe-4S)-binding protein [Bacteroidia bacterium]|nr:(4Fe-4S)-binding protein [Bacteroidia bacterium]HQU99934.1 (4Fe-4S)-binding protein [Bacteroidia bacterium]
MRSVTKEYSNGQVTIVWQNSLCAHSAICFKGLPQVFNPNVRPWINATGATTQQIIDQVKRCPSGALSIKELADQSIQSTDNQTTLCEVTHNGPLLIHGSIKVVDAMGNETIKEKTTAFCRCGASHKKPYCDGSHRKIGFEG